MSNFFRALRRAAARLDRTAGFDAPPGTRPYRSVGDTVGELQSMLNALDEDAGLAPRGTSTVDSTLREIEGIGLESSRLAEKFVKRLNKGR